MNTLDTRFRGAAVKAGVLGVVGVALGALGAHSLAGPLAERGTAHVWETAARHHMLHVIALFGAAAWLRQAQGASARRIAWAANAWVVGILLFSGSLYALALGGPRWLGPITPFGGLAFMAGWVAVVAAAFAREE